VGVYRWYASLIPYLLTPVYININTVCPYTLLSYAGVRTYIYVYNPMRVGVHICVYTKKKGVASFMTRTRSYTSNGIYKYICIGIEISICMNMPSKIKESTKVYKRDRNNRMTNQYTWKHFTVSGTPTHELISHYKNLPRKRNIIRRELLKRNVDIPSI